MSRHETSDANIRIIARFGIGLFVLVIVALFAMWTLFGYLARQPTPGPEPSRMALGEQEPPPEPRLQVGESTDLQRMHAAEENILQSYGWVDREGGIARIPIDRAIELYLESRNPK